MKALISDTAKLREHTKKSGLKFRDAIIEYYRLLGEKQGFTVVRETTVIKNAHDFGKLDLAWLEPNIVFQQEFGLPDDIYRHLWRIMVLKPAIAVLLLSGNSKCNPKDVRGIVEHTPQLKGIEFVIVDVTAK